MQEVNKRKREESQSSAEANRPKKKVRWDSSVREITAEQCHPFFQRPRKKIKSMRLKTIIYDHARRNEKEELRRDLAKHNITDELLKSHYAEAVCDVVYRAILINTTPQLLQFIFDALPLSCIQAALNNENRDILEQLFHAPPFLKELNIYTVRRQQVRVERWKALLRIDQKGVESFMHEHAENPDSPKESYVEFRKALAELGQTPMLSETENHRFSNT